MKIQLKVNGWVRKASCWLPIASTVVVQEEKLNSDGTTTLRPRNVKMSSTRTEGYVLAVRGLAVWGLRQAVVPTNSAEKWPGEFKVPIVEKTLGAGQPAEMGVCSVVAFQEIDAHHASSKVNSATVLTAEGRNVPLPLGTLIVAEIEGIEFYYRFQGATGFGRFFTFPATLFIPTDIVVARGVGAYLVPFSELSHPEDLLDAEVIKVEDSRLEECG